MTRLVGAFALAALALFMLSGYLASGLDRDSGASIAALALVVGLPTVAAVLLFRAHFRDHGQAGAKKEALRVQTVESEILRLAADRGGKLTAVEVAVHLALSPEAATEALDRLALRSQASYEVTDAGVIVYSFYDIIHLDGKHSARGVLE